MKFIIINKMLITMNTNEYINKCEICGRFIPNNHEIKVLHEKQHVFNYTYELPNLNRIIEHFKNIF